MKERHRDGRRQRPWKVVLLCLGVPETGLAPVLAASADGGRAEPHRRGTQSSGHGLPTEEVPVQSLVFHRCCSMEEIGQHHIYRLCLGMGEMTGN